MRIGEVILIGRDRARVEGFESVPGGIEVRLYFPQDRTELAPPPYVLEDTGEET